MIVRGRNTKPLPRRSRPPTTIAAVRPPRAVVAPPSFRAADTTAERFGNGKYLSGKRPVA
ncbi:hypothetical protein HSR122_2137 [Halapricum desulfuricans]|uniref:Uncharacterized protein n=1 Tax=Halapricum desulfuricans TaxID=2841257 RepID=A0A897NAU7_9EURY|nr:hypothetical protein HSR122_2137 [Halapricum desulfuricans]